MEREHLSADWRTWAVPSIMKMGKPFTVPLGPVASRIVREAAETHNGRFVFRFGQAQAEAAVRHGDVIMRRGICDTLGWPQVTTHGFRSSFRTWVDEQTATPHAVAEAALAHQIPSAVERAYRRSDFADQRRDLLRLWEAFALSEATA